MKHNKYRSKIGKRNKKTQKRGRKEKEVFGRAYERSATYPIDQQPWNKGGYKKPGLEESRHQSGQMVVESDRFLK